MAGLAQPSKQDCIMLSRRDFLAVASAAATIAGRPLKALAQKQQLSEAELLRFTPKGQVTILHMADCHAQVMPIYFREPSVNIGVGASKGQPPHLTGEAFLNHFGIKPGTAQAYMLTDEDFTALAREYGKVGGMDRMARLINAIRSERRSENVLLLDGGDTMQGSYTALQTKGADMVRIVNALGIEATTGHWEFTLGEERLLQIFGDKTRQGECKAAFLAANVFNDEWLEPAFVSMRMFEKGGVPIAVIGQAFPFTPIANPRWMVPNWSFGIRETRIRESVAAARRAGAAVVVLLSHNGFDVDRKLAGRIEGLDIILTGHTHDALPQPLKVNSTLLVASGSSGKFLSRLDIDVQNKRIADFSYSLIPVLSDAIKPDPDMARLVQEIRAPHLDRLKTPLARTETLLYRRGNFNGTFDDLICDAILQERDAEIALSPGFRWGTSLLPGQDITWEDVFNATAITYPQCYRTTLSGQRLKEILEDVADNLFNENPYYQQGGDMVRVGGLAFTCDVGKTIGNRIGNMRLLRTDRPIEATKDYAVAGWASINRDTEGPPIWDVVGDYLKKKKTIRLDEAETVAVKGG